MTIIAQLTNSTIVYSLEQACTVNHYSLDGELSGAIPTISHPIA